MYSGTDFSDSFFQGGAEGQRSRELIARVMRKSIASVTAAALCAKVVSQVNPLVSQVNTLVSSVIQAIRKSVASVTADQLCSKVHILDSTLFSDCLW
jgi:hypothetical protein